MNMYTALVKTILCLLLISKGLFCSGQSSQDLIKINQLGYYTKGPKIAVLTSDYISDNDTKTRLKFFVLTGKDTAFKGQLSYIQQSTNSPIKTRIADFSPLTQNGTFIIYIPDIGSSYSFEIKKEVHRASAVAGLKGFYYTRVSMPLSEQFAGKWKRPAGHPDTQVLVHASAATPTRPTATVISSPGGWYDAGDYNKYIVNSGITMGTLLSAYEDFPAYFKISKTNIPESNNAVPDILDEILYNLRWMQTMQDPNDGGVYHKCTNANFDGMVMPGATKLPRYVVQKTTAAALDFAAVMAQSSRILKAFENDFKGLSDSLLKSATAAWLWAVKNPAVVYDQEENNKKFEPKITTGAYGDKMLYDEWLWAAAELFATTGTKTYFDSVTRRLPTVTSLPSWNNVGTLAVYTLIRQKNSLPSFSHHLIPALHKRVIAFADSLIGNVSTNAFYTVMGGAKTDFIWGSSAVAANQGIALVNAYLITKDKKYVDHALGNLDYLLGRNATGYCFLTGLGSKRVMRPHHRPSIADGIDEPVPGLLSGGPNPGKQDKCHYEYSDPERAFSDTDCSFASNEIAINWNAPFVYLANALEALQKQAGY